MMTRAQSIVAVNRVLGRGIPSREVINRIL
jgi:hypothetical protein